MVDAGDANARPGQQHVDVGFRDVLEKAEVERRSRQFLFGLVVIAEARRATFLPKVWEMLPDPRQFLVALKAKCGLAEDYWSERVEFRRYRTTTYEEPVAGQ